MVRLTALLDANVLYPAGLRDLLLRLADRYLFAPLRSADIDAELIDSLLADRPDIDRRVLDRTRAVMDRHFPGLRAFHLPSTSSRSLSCSMGSTKTTNSEP